jgi:hypothetical protein
MRKHDIQFPLLTISGNILDFKRSPNQIGRCTRVALKNRYYDQLRGIDQSGNEYRVVGVTDPKLAKSKKYEFIGYLTGNPSYFVSLEWEKHGKLDLRQVRELLEGNFKVRKYFWNEMIDFDDFRDAIRSATSIPEIFSIFENFNF